MEEKEEVTDASASNFPSEQVLAHTSGKLEVKADSQLEGSRTRKRRHFEEFETNAFVSSAFREKIPKLSAKTKMKLKSKKKEKTRQQQRKVIRAPIPPAGREVANASKDRLLNDVEDRCINSAVSLQLEMEKLLEAQAKDLPSGHVTLKDQKEALIRGVSENTSVILDWESDPIKMLGCLCKVYWDGEDTWYYARILNFDSNKGKHYIFYLEDNTAEWIDLSSECVLVAKELVLSKFSRSSSVWPAVYFWASVSAQERLVKTPGYIRSGVYVEFFHDTFLKEYAFVAEDTLLFPIQEQNFPKKPSKKFFAALSTAKSENGSRAAIVEEVKNAMIADCFKFLHGKDWIGVKVRTDTHSIIRKEIATKKSAEAEEGSQPFSTAVKCIGRVAQYCPSLRLWLVLFNPELQPRWIVCEKGQVEVIPEKVSVNTVVPIPVEGEEMMELSSGLIERQEEVPSTSNELETAHSIPSCGSCLLCNRIPMAFDLVLQCTQCKSICHETCAPPNDFLPINHDLVANKTSKQPFKWKCWNCKVCQNCSVSIWERPLIYWNIRRKFPRSASDRILLLCGLCLKMFKYSQDYCTICFRPYGGDLGTICVSRESLRRAPSSHDVSSAGDDMTMIQCNECERWIHANCEGIDALQYQSITDGTHPIWGEEYLCPMCRIDLGAALISRLEDLDHSMMFSEPVTESVASNYFDIIHNPMDLSTIKEKNQRGHYKSLQPLRNDVELMCCNALIFNRTGDDVWMYALHYFQEVEDSFENNSHRTQLTAYGLEAQQIIAQSNISFAHRQSSSSVTAKRKRKAENPLTESEGKRGKVVEAEHKVSLDQNEREITAADDMDDTLVNGSLNLEEGGTVSDDLPLVQISLQMPHEPSSFVNPFFILQSMEVAYYGTAMEVCLVCGSGGSSSNFLFCIDCGEAFHSFCCNAPQSMSHTAKEIWRCPNCKICEICCKVSEMDAENADNMILCELCDSSFHIACLDPPFPSASVREAINVTSNTWYCSDCVRCTKHEQKVEGNCSWGFSTTVCFRCSFSAFSLSEQVLGNGCEYCTDLQSIPFKTRIFSCRSCEKCFHFECLQEKLSQIASLPADFYEFYEGQLCFECSCVQEPSCISSRDHTMALSADLFPKAESQLTGICEIQSIRLQRIRQESQGLSEGISSALKILSQDQIIICVIMALWGNLRKLLFEENRRCTDSVINHRSVILPDNNLIFMPTKARRYVNCLRRRISSMARNSELSRSGLLSAANLASSFTFVSDLEGVNLRHGLTEIVLISVEIALLFLRTYPSLFLAGPSDSSSLVMSLEHIIGKIYQSIGIHLTLRGNNRPLSPFAHFLLPVQSHSLSLEQVSEVEEVLSRVPHCLHLSTPQDLKTIESYLFENFREISTNERQEVASLLQMVFGKRLLNLTPQDVPNKPIINSSSFMHKLLEKFQATRKALICKSVTINTSASHISNRIGGSLPRLSALCLPQHDRKQPIACNLPCGFETSTSASNEALMKTVKEIQDDLVTRFDHEAAPTAIDALNIEQIFEDYCSRYQIELSGDSPAVEESAVDENRASDNKQNKDLKPNRGWQLSPSAKACDWLDTRFCLFCSNQEELPLLGRLLPFSDGGIAHVNCLLWCSEVQVVGGQLVHAEEARSRCCQQTCYFCLKRGATINCCRGMAGRKCRRSYHLRCALSSSCLLLRLKAKYRSQENEKNEFRAFCPEHIIEKDSLLSLSNYEQWVPEEPLKCLVVETCPIKEEMKNVAEILSRQRTDVAVKTGSVSILKIGFPVTDKPGFSSNRFIYPHLFTSCRIYWSIENAGQRTVYLFEILDHSDVEGWDGAKMGYLHRSLLTVWQSRCSSVVDADNSSQPLLPEAGLHDLLNGPIFRVVCLDAVDRPIFSRSVEDLYHFLWNRLLQLRDSSPNSQSVATRSRRRSSFDSYNLTAHQFFGLGLPFVQEAIEAIPSSVLSMISLNSSERYSPIFRLPSNQDIQDVIKSQSSLRSVATNYSQNGASRADPFAEKLSHENITVRISSTKTAGEDSLCTETVSSTAGDAAETDEYITDLSKENSKAEIESRKVRFLDMTKAYKKSPYAKLEVRKSRIHGWGLYSKINYERDDVIVEYIGEKVRQVVADRREANYELEGVGSCYLFRLDKDDIIDATKIGGMSRFINHCCEPNAYARIIEYENTESKQTEKHIVIMAAKNIQEGEEITYDYKFPIEDNKLKCFCGAPRCSGSMN